MGPIGSKGLSPKKPMDPFPHFTTFPLPQKGHPMKRDIVKDIIFLQQKAAPATFEDKAIANDLKDTLAAHADKIGRAHV